MQMASLPSTVYITLCSALHTPCGYMSLLCAYQQHMCDLSNSQCPGLRALQSWDAECPTALVSMQVSQYLPVMQAASLPALAI